MRRHSSTAMGIEVCRESLTASRLAWRTIGPPVRTATDPE
jgi:hypothetical protein